MSNIPTSPNVAFVTMGCAKNEVDTDKMRERVLSAGFSLVDEVEAADAIVINTCSFIQSATEESLDAIFEAAELPRVSSGDAKIIVAGCMPARYGEELEGELPEAAACIPCSKEDDIATVVARALGISLESVVDQGNCPEAKTKTFAYVKISDGCDRWCSYCTIPLIRGRYRSFTYEQIKADVARHVAAGVREIDLIAQDTGRWGADFDDSRTLAWLIDELATAFPQTWIRVMYLQPEGVTDELLSVMAQHDNVCKYLDIPLQHVNETILRSMNRRGSRASFETLFKRILTAVPAMTLRTTLIAGFPGETDDQFEELCDFVEESPFHYIGVFPYSREEGTKAYDLPDQVEEDEKRDRAQRLRDLADDICTPHIAARIGSTERILVEGVEEDGQLFGRAMCQAPDVDGVTYLDRGEIGDIVEAKIVDTLMYEMEGE